MQTKVCIGCEYSETWGCNCCVQNGGCGMNDKVASDYLKEGEECQYRKEGKPNNLPYQDKLSNAWGS